MTADREKLREDVARAIQAAINRNGTTADLADAAIALIWPAAMREAAEKCLTHSWSRDVKWWLDVTKKDATAEAAKECSQAILSLLSPVAEKEEGR